MRKNYKKAFLQFLLIEFFILSKPEDIQYSKIDDLSHSKLIKEFFDESTEDPNVTIEANEHAEIDKTQTKKNENDDILFFNNTSSQLEAFFDDAELNSKKITFKSKPAKINDVIELIANIAGIDLAIDQDVNGSCGKVSFIDATPGKILKYICSKNNPQLALIKDMDVWRVVLRSRAEQSFNSKETHVIAHHAIDIKHAHLDEKFKDHVEKTWQNIVDKENQKDSSLIVDLDRKKVFIRGRAHHVEEFRSFLSAIDTPITQVRIDAILIFVQKSFGIDFGINWSGIYNRQNTLIQRNCPGFVGLGGRLTDFPTPTKSDFPNNENLLVNPLNFALNLFTKNFNDPRNNGTTSNGVVDTFFKLPLVFGGPDLNLRRLNLVLNAAEFENKVKILERPSIVTRNNEKARIIIGQSIPIQTTIQDIIQGIPRNVTSVNYKDIGVTLEVLPTISPDKKSVALEFLLQVSAVVSGTTRTNEQGIMTNPPVISLANVHNKVILKNGQTVAVGGYSMATDRKASNKLPILWRIPILGRLLRSDSDLNEEQEQYILITPSIMDRDL